MTTGSSRDGSAANGVSPNNPCRSRPTGIWKLARPMLSCRSLAVNAMQKLIEFYEMACFNNAALCERELLAILEARRALGRFTRAMENFKMAPTETAGNTETTLRQAA